MADVETITDINQNSSNNTDHLVSHHHFIRVQSHFGIDRG